MGPFIVYPAIDLRRGKVVRLRQGDPARQKEYGDDPAAAAKRWLSAGTEWLHVINLDGALAEQDSENQRALQAILEQAGQQGRSVQFGGGLRTLEQVDRVLSLGVQRAVLGTAAVEKPELIEQAVSRFGAKSLAVSLDARQGIVQVRGWQSGSAWQADALGRKLAETGLETLIFTNIARDGTGSGVDIAATQNLASSTGLQMIASGGVNSLQEVRQARAAGLAGIIIGRALYEGIFQLEEALGC